MILSDTHIQDACLSGLLVISPFRDDQCNPASYNVRLHNQALFWKRNRYDALDLANPVDGLMERVSFGEHYKDGYRLQPGESALFCTQERIKLPDYMVARVEGRSSLGRLGLIVHQTAGFIDPGFAGHVTLEVMNQNPQHAIVLLAGMQIAQLAFELVAGQPTRRYSGKYQNQPDRPVESRIYREIQMEFSHDES